MTDEIKVLYLWHMASVEDSIELIWGPLFASITKARKMKKKWGSNKDKA